MPRSPDARPGELLEDDGILLGSQVSDPTSVGEIRNVSGSFRFMDSIGVFNPRGSGITESQHKVLDQLVHDIAETCYYEVTYASSKITAETWWTDGTKTIKIREILYTYSGSKVAAETWHQFDAAGAQIATLAIAYTYSGSTIVSATYTYSEP